MRSVPRPLSLIFFATSFLLLPLVAPCAPASGSTGTATWDTGRLVLDNGAVRREIALPGADGPGLATLSLTTPGNGRNYLNDGSLEFRFLLDGEPVDGSSGWSLAGCRPAADDLKGEGATIVLRGTEGAAAGLRLEITYLLYPELPVIRKRITFTNEGGRDLRLEGVDVENLRTGWSDIHSWVMNDYARQRHLGPYVGDSQDCLVILHDIIGRRGIAVGNEAPAVMKRTAAFLDSRNFTAGLTHPDQDYPFRAWLEPGETWESPQVFIAPYADATHPEVVLNGAVNDFVRRHLGLRLRKAPHVPMFVYNTWNPFRKEVSDTLVRQLAEAAAECGVEEFIIDDGWQVLRGDWDIDREKFPDGLKPVFDHIKSLGMKPGLWLSLGSANSRSRVFREHPEWFVRDSEGNLANLHGGNGTLKTACMATGWYDHIKSVLLNLYHEHGLGYVKLDFAVAASAYVYDPDLAGCRATDHPRHRDREESLLVAYRRCNQLFDELHREAPDLFIDCTFEVWGELQLVDYSLVKHAEGDWLSNVESPAPLGTRRVRHLAWWRSPAVPAAALVIGNQTLDDPMREHALLSLAGSLPIMLGDPRQVPPAERARLEAWAGWLRSMQERHGYMLFRRDLPGYGEPLEGAWDGWARINTDTGSGGIVGIFRQGSAESERRLTVDFLDPDGRYVVRRGPDNAEVTRLSGAELARSGFAVRLSEPNDAALFEIARVE